MRFADKRYYIDRYVKCQNCGMLIYDEGLAPGPRNGGLPAGTVFCSGWCTEWHARKAEGMDAPRLKLPTGGDGV